MTWRRSRRRRPATCFPIMADRRLPTRALLIAASFAAVQTVLFALVVPVTTVLAASAPPAYALVAAVHSAMPLLARLVTALPGTATITAGITAILTAALSPIGLLAGVPMLVAGVVYDVVLGRGRGGVSAWRVSIAAVAAGVALFAVSLPVFSPDHLVAPVLLATLVCRVAGQVLVGLLAVAVARLLGRAGIRRTAVR